MERRRRFKENICSSVEGCGRSKTWSSMHVTHHKRIHDSVKQVIGTVLNMADVTLAGRPCLIHGCDGLVVMGDDVIAAKEDIQLFCLRFEYPFFLFIFHYIEDNVDIVTPVVYLWGVGLLQGIVNGERMKTETAQDRLSLFDGFIDEIHPEDAFSIPQEAGELSGRDSGADGLAGRVKE
jgi:hypothetical protein